jgi:hypothetical protein
MPRVRAGPDTRVMRMGEHGMGMVPPTVWGGGGARGFVSSGSVGVCSDVGRAAGDSASCNTAADGGTARKHLKLLLMPGDKCLPILSGRAT